MTTGISLVRENAASLQPPRTLWVPFPLGRPLGVPGDPAFQHRVIRAGLALLEASEGPVLADYPEDAPKAESEDAPVCPVSFATDQTTWRGRLLAELATLTPWYEIGLRRRRSRTLVGICASDLPEILNRFAEDLEQNRLPNDLKWFKAAIEDAKAYYVEALTAQPGQYDIDQIYETIWHDTQLGAALKAMNQRFLDHPKLQGFARILLPRSAVESIRTRSGSS